MSSSIFSEASFNCEQQIDIRKGRGSETYPLVLFALGLQLFLVKRGRLELFDRGFEPHHVGMGALVESLGVHQLLLQSFVLLLRHPHLPGHLADLFLAEAFLTHLLECVALAILNAL